MTQIRAETDRAAAEASRKSAQLLAESEQKAEQIVAEAIARADRIRSESERELAAATQRRDSINSQLTNVRQMLATLSGTTPAAVSLPIERSPVAQHDESETLQAHDEAEAEAEAEATEPSDEQAMTQATS